MGQSRTVVITGATRGIGRNMALHFAKHGYRVIGTGRDPEKLEELDRELRARNPAGRAIALDILQPQQVKQVVSEVFNAFGDIHVWINNAGLFKAIGPTWEVDPATWVADLNTNLIGTFHCMHVVLPQMIRQQGGRVINIVGGGTGGEFKYGSAYGVSKTAIARLTENAAAELDGTSVRCFALDPGLNKTDMTLYQVESAAGQKYLPRVQAMFEQNRDVPPNVAPELALAIANGELDAYHGRIVGVYEEVDTWRSRAAGGLNQGTFKLRISRS